MQHNVHFSRYCDHSTFFMERVVDENSYNCDICCIAMSSYNNIQVVCRPEFGTALVRSLEMISNSLSTSYTMKEPVDINGWHVYKFKYSSHFWSHDNSEALSIGRLLIGRVMFHLGKEQGWSFLVNGNIKDTADYLWFVRDRNQQSIYQSPCFAGFEVPLSADCAVVTPSSTDKLRFINFPTRIMEPLQSLIASIWTIQKYTPNKDLENCHQFKLKGNPWWSSGIEAVQSRMLVMKCITFLLGIRTFNLVG